MKVHEKTMYLKAPFRIVKINQEERVNTVQQTMSNHDSDKVNIISVCTFFSFLEYFFFSFMRQNMAQYGFIYIKILN